MSYIYKSFDSVQFFLENLWNLIPNINSQKVNVKNDKFITNLIVTSDEFCDLKEQGKLKIKVFSEGGFGQIGILTGKNNIKIQASVLSLSNENNSIFYTDIVIKENKNDVSTEIVKLDYRTIMISDPISDMVFGSIMGHLYDTGINPFVTKYFGNYICGQSIYMAMEAADVEIRQLISRYHPQRPTVLEFKNILMQLFYSTFILKHYFGLVHHDSHLRNLMIKYTKDYFYKGKNFNDIDVIFFETGFKDSKNRSIFVAIKNIGCIIKSIDYGSMSCSLDNSRVARFKHDCRITTNKNDIRAIGAEHAFNEALKSRSYQNTKDIMFTLINLYEFLFNGLDKETNAFDKNAPVENKPYLDVLDEIGIAFMGDTFLNLRNSRPTYRIKKDWYMRNHDTGMLKPEYENENFLLKTMIKCCNRNFLMEKWPFNDVYKNKKILVTYFEKEIDKFFENDNCYNSALVLNHNTDEYNLLLNRLENIIHHKQKCKYDTKSCRIVELFQNDYPLERLSDEDIYEDGEFFDIITGEFQIKENPIYKNYNSWLNANRIPNMKLHRPIENVRTIKIKIKKFKKATLTIGEQLLNTDGVSFPIGNFNSENMKMFGLFINRKTSQAYTNPYPNIYDQNLAVLASDNYILSLEKYSVVLKKYKTNAVPFNMIENEKSSVQILENPLNSLKNVTWAVTVGPILVWDSKIVFTPEEAKVISLDSTNSKSVIIGNTSEYIYVGKGPGKYGMTDSNEIQTQLVLLMKGESVALVLVEGGGYLTPGLDRFQTALMCKNLGPEKAVCVSCGYNTNVLLDTKNNKQKYLSKSPLRFKHGAILNLSSV